MTLFQVINILEQIALIQPNIRTVSDGSIYESLNTNPNIEYDVFHVSQTTHRIEDDIDYYGFNLFYVSRLDDTMENNRLAIQSLAKESLTNIIRVFCEDYGAIEMPILRFYPFTQRFVDEYAGMYVSIEIGIPIEWVCDEDFGDIGEIVPFSPYKDEHLPDVDALYIGGGYPEVFKQDLSNNKSMLQDIKKFHDDNRPIYGECGGLIYLSKSIDGLDMVNAIPYSSEMTDRVQGLNYIVARANQDNLISNEGDIFRGHEFHYTKLNINDTKGLVFDVLRGRGVLNNMDGVSIKNTLANYIHIHACSHPNFGYNFTSNIADLDI